MDFRMAPVDLLGTPVSSLRSLIGFLHMRKDSQDTIWMSYEKKILSEDSYGCPKGPDGCPKSSIQRNPMISQEPDGCPAGS
eukprot:5186242-Pyramimonas_sp.AAC.1